MAQTHYRKQINAFAQSLRQEERAQGTIENYLRHLRAFAAWLGGGELTPATAPAWKAELLAKGYAPGTVNAMLVPLNRFLDFLGYGNCKVKALRIQRRLFRENRKELTRQEYDRLLSTARAQGKERLALLMEAICATGIRVSEVQYLTVKGKIRTILIPSKLRKKLLQYAKKEKNASGAVFRTRNGKPLSRKQIWAEMKALCSQAGVAASKVFPHNLRHLFARAFYNVSRDVAKLADVLGHSSLETTRLYLISTGKEHERQLERLGFVK